jgi:hypothetical protein
VSEEYVKEVVDPQITKSQLEGREFDKVKHMCIMLQVYLKLNELMALGTGCAVTAMTYGAGPTHTILLSYPVLRNYLHAKLLQSQLSIKLMENKMPSKPTILSQLTYYTTFSLGPLPMIQVDEQKLHLIDYEYFINTFENLLDIIHLGKLLHIRGTSLCLFDIAFIGKSAFISL